jgi:hypothetical protein
MSKQRGHGEHPTDRGEGEGPRDREAPTIYFEGGPRHGDTDTADYLPAVIGSGAERGVYERTGERRDDLSVYRWRSLTEAQAQALVRGDLRANQGSDR